MKADIRSFVTSSGLSLDIWRLSFTDHTIKNYWCARWSKHSAKHLLHQMRSSLWNAQPSFWNTRPSFWGFKRKLKARPRVWKVRPGVCVITGLCCHNCYITDFIVHISSYFLQSTLHRSCFILFSSVHTSLFMFHFISFSPHFIVHVSSYFLQSTPHIIYHSPSGSYLSYLGCIHITWSFNLIVSFKFQAIPFSRN